MSGELWRQPLEKLAPAIRAGKVSPVALTEACLDRIEKVDGKLDSFIHVSKHALESSRAAEREIKAGKYRGPLHGIPIGVKDNYLTSDMPTTAGSTAPGLSFPLRDSAAASRLRSACWLRNGRMRSWRVLRPTQRSISRLERGDRAACVPGDAEGAVPLVGGITALWVRGMHLNLSASVGFIALFGVAVLNGVRRGTASRSCKWGAVATMA